MKKKLLFLSSFVIFNAISCIGKGKINNVEDYKAPVAPKSSIAVKEIFQNENVFLINGVEKKQNEERYKMAFYSEETESYATETLVFQLKDNKVEDIRLIADDQTIFSTKVFVKSEKYRYLPKMQALYEEVKKLREVELKMKALIHDGYSSRRRNGKGVITYPRFERQAENYANKVFYLCDQLETDVQRSQRRIKAKRKMSSKQKIEKTRD